MASTKIPGDAQVKPCLTKAAQLILDIYNYKDAELTDVLKRKKAEIAQHWVRGWYKGNDEAVSLMQADEEGDSGIFCRMYYPKLASGQVPMDVCPPALVFRGSEMNEADLDQIAVHVEIAGTVSTSGVMTALHGGGPFSLPIPVLTPAKGISPGSTRAQLRAANMTEKPLIDTSTGQAGGTLSMGSLFEMGTITLDWTGSASLFYGNRGDWPTNIAQAFGEIPQQYLEAVEAAQIAASEAMRDWNGRLLIVGHSLGGGLASLAALAAKAQEPDLVVHCRTYNASGLHANTAAEAGLALSGAADAGIVSYAVAGDVLNTLQANTMLPLMSDIMRWAGVSLPKAIPNSAPSQGISPGGSPSMMFTKLERAPEWANLPRLFPLYGDVRQQLVPDDLATIRQILTAAENAATFTQFVDNLVAMLFRELGDGSGTLGTRHMIGLVQAYRNIGPQFATAGPQMAAAIKQDPDSTTIPELDFGMMGGNAERFTNGLIRDSIRMAQIMMAAVDYHMWDACAYTFVLDK